jgi:hypothetical protein
MSYHASCCSDRSNTCDSRATLVLPFCSALFQVPSKQRAIRFTAVPPKNYCLHKLRTLSSSKPVVMPAWPTTRSQNEWDKACFPWGLAGFNTTSRMAKYKNSPAVSLITPADAVPGNLVIVILLLFRVHLCSAQLRLLSQMGDERHRSGGLFDLPA